jgi:hypothetical protein
MVTISEAKGTARENRTAAHTHIKGLGLRADGYAEEAAAGFVGQVAAREVRFFRFPFPCPPFSPARTALNAHRPAASSST